MRRPRQRRDGEWAKIEEMKREETRREKTLREQEN